MADNNKPVSGFSEIKDPEVHRTLANLQNDGPVVVADFIANNKGKMSDNPDVKEVAGHLAKSINKVKSSEYNIDPEHSKIIKDSFKQYKDGGLAAESNRDAAKEAVKEMLKKSIEEGIDLEKNTEPDKLKEMVSKNKAQVEARKLKEKMEGMKEKKGKGKEENGLSKEESFVDKVTSGKGPKGHNRGG